MSKRKYTGTAYTYDVADASIKYVLKTPCNEPDICGSKELLLEDFFRSIMSEKQAIHIENEKGKIFNYITEQVDDTPGFCGKDMSTTYLVDSIDDATHFALFRVISYQTPKPSALVHSVITFTLKGDYIEVDAFCVNNTQGFKGAGVLMNRLFDACIHAGIDTVKLKSIPNTPTLKYYEKMGFETETPSTPDPEGLIHKKKRVELSDAKGYDMIANTLLESAESRSKLDPGYLKELRNASASVRGQMVHEIRLKREISRPSKLLKDYITKFSSVGTRRVRGEKRKSMITKVKSKKNAKTKVKTKKRRTSSSKVFPAFGERVKRTTPVLEDSDEETTV